ncbi:MAG: hypothetical protein QOD88_1077 [Mycobacterium sp.]|nr:hypothetical protein [Mycobacterium sp.]
MNRPLGVVVAMLSGKDRSAMPPRFLATFVCEGNSVPWRGISLLLHPSMA